MFPKNPHFIDWAITSKCNLSCRHCRGMSKGELTTHKAVSVISEIAKLQPEWIIIEGGEPLLRNDLFDLLNLIQRNNIDVYLITNGTLITPQILSSLKALKVKLMISVDGATASTYESIRNGASYKRVIEQAHICAGEGLLASLNFTVMRSNYTEIPGIFEIARSLDVKQITIIGFKPCHGYQNELLAPEEYLEAIRLSCEGAEKTGIDFFFDEPFFQAVVKEKGFYTNIPKLNAGIVTSSTSACIFGEYLFIDTNGDVKPCSFAPIIIDNVNNKLLSDIWDELSNLSFFQKIRDPDSRTGACRSCQYLFDCKGCRSRTFMVTGDWFSTDPCCPLIGCQA
ncbi:MAG: radical SAM protein [Dehalococcoidales bacterium]|nr:radical SAM protein [Dehalococcoidales bacterium]